MKQKNWFIFSGGLMVIAFIGGFMINAGLNPNDSEKPTEEDETPVPQELVLKFPTYTIPDGINFAGETVPLNDFEVYERLDMELHAAVYRNSATLAAFKKANRYFPVIEPILQEKGIPDDFKYLCVVESNLANAVSSAGAGGFWQFMPKTAASYNLTVNTEIDERYNLVKATYAACDFLKKAYEKFGSWTSAAASYNMGMAGLSGDMTEQKQTNYYDLRLNSETSRYVIKIAATKILFSDPGFYGYSFKREDVYPVIPTRSVEVTTSIADLAQYAIDQGTTYKILRELNPWLLKNTLTVAAGKSYTLLLPGDGWNNYRNLQTTGSFRY